MSNCQIRLSEYPFLTGCSSTQFAIPILNYESGNYENYNIDFSELKCLIDTDTNTFVTGGTLSGNTLVLERNDGESVYIDLSSLSPTYFDTYISGGTYSGGYLWFSGHGINFSVDVSPLIDDTNTYVTGATLSGNTLILTRNDGVEISADLSTLNIGSDYIFTGGSGTCITDLFVTNLYGCSPITLHSGFKSPNASSVSETSFCFGNNSRADGTNSITFGVSCNNSASYSQAFGSSHTVSNDYACAFGDHHVVTGKYGSAFGTGGRSLGEASHSFGRETVASANYAEAFGWGNESSQMGAHTEGGVHYDVKAGVTSKPNRATNYSAHAGGVQNIASGLWSFCHGYQNSSSGEGSYAGGRESAASGEYAWAFGLACNSNSYYSHAEGRLTTANGIGTHAQNEYTLANGRSSHAGGQGYSLSFPVQATGEGAFIHSARDNTIATAGAAGLYSAILGGKNNYVEADYGVILGSYLSWVRSGDNRSVILGGQNIVSSAADTVYVPNLNINSAPALDENGSILCRSSNGNISYRTAASIASPFTGNTSATCISDLYVHNLGGCSPINLLTDIIPNSESIISIGGSGYSFANIFVSAITINDQLITTISTDETLSSNSDSALVTEKVVKTYVDNIGQPYKVYSANISFGLKTTNNGLLEIGKTYLIQNYMSSDDFTNVGASSNATGVVFVATGTTPNDWSNMSELYYDMDAITATTHQNTVGNVVWEYDTTLQTLKGTLTNAFPDEDKFFGLVSWMAKPVAPKWVDASTFKMNNTLNLGFHKESFEIRYYN